MLRVRDAHSHTHTHTCGNTKTQKSTNVTLQTRPCRYGCYSFSPCWSEAATATATSHHSMTSADPSLSEQEALSPPKRLQKHEAVAFFLWGGIGHVTSPPPSVRPSFCPPPMHREQWAALCSRQLDRPRPLAAASAAEWKTLGTTEAPQEGGAAVFSQLQEA